MEPKPRILVVGGSPRQRGRTQAVSRFVAEVLVQLDANVRHVELSEAGLPIYDGSAGQGQDASLMAWKSAAAEADAFFLVTPDYHNGMSGALKNALDFLGGSHFRHKPAAIAAVAGGGKGGINALNNLRIVLRGLYALTLPEQAVIDKHQIDDRLELADEQSRERLTEMANELIKLSRRLLSD